MTDASVAPHGIERVFLVDDGATGATWWSAYAARLADSGIDDTSRDVIKADAQFIVERGVFGAGEAGAQGWSSARERRGLVMGAVQSGKTASMMAVAAMALDRGVDALVLLSGTRTALWLQTFERVLEQLDTLTDAHRRRVRVPSGKVEDVDGSDLDLVYGITRARAERAIAKGRPVVAVAMKNTAHLERLGRTLHDVLYPLAAERERPFHLLVIDDEADDSSIVDASLEGVGDDLRRKQVPRRIVDLWESRHRPGQTAHQVIFATYLAYTATPQANFLQDDSNPLAPLDFVASLRTPGASGDSAVRESSFRVPGGLRSWYTGGDIYYKALSDVPLCLATDEVEPDDLVVDGVRAYLVASAIRVLRSTDRLDPAAARVTGFSTREEARAKVARPMSALINPTAATEGHFEVAQRVLNWSYSNKLPNSDGLPSGAFGRALGSSGISADMANHEDRWLRWIDRYAQGAAVIAATFPGSPQPSVLTDWPLLRSVILERVVPGTGVSVINSDDRADDRPEFSPRPQPDGTWRAAPNTSTIFVSGNVMSRGLTLEGLTTTVFTRAATTPLADTQMQMQRWFGYRGSYIDLCRVLMPQDQIDLFSQYHENDEALRRDVLASMEAGKVPNLTILQGRSFKATGKIANLQARPLFPGAKPFVRHMNPPGSDLTNLRLVVDLFCERSIHVLSPSGPRGLLVDEPVSLGGAAEILDSLRYVDHGPGPGSGEADRWRSVANHAKITDRALYAAPAVPGSVDLGHRSPYSIAAYLRLWDAVTTRNVPGLVTTDERPVAWNLIDREVLERRRPRFWLGLRFGGGTPVKDGPLAELPFEVRPMQRFVVEGSNDLGASWGARNASSGVIQGDEVFDYMARGMEPDLTLEGSRVPGSDGLMLFHIVERDDGSTTIALGLGIPLGGPDHIRVRGGGTS